MAFSRSGVSNAAITHAHAYQWLIYNQTHEQSTRLINTRNAFVMQSPCSSKTSDNKSFLLQGHINSCLEKIEKLNLILLNIISKSVIQQIYIYSLGDRILELYNVLVQIRLTVSKTKRYIQYLKLGVRVASQVAERRKTQDLRK